MVYPWFVACALVPALACGDDGGNTLATDAANPSDAMRDASGDASGDATSDGPAPMTFTEMFAADGAAWPAGWSQLGGVASATVATGRGVLAPTASAYSLARMGHAFGARDVEVTFTLTLQQATQSGVGFYVRQNGGYLRQTATFGGGYAVFVEGFRGPQIGLWRERDGVEEELAPPFVATTLANDAVYAVRFRCEQTGAMTTLSGKIWPAAQAEPAAFSIVRTDATPALQNVGGGIAVDSYWVNTSGSAPAITVDDIVVTEL